MPSATVPASRRRARRASRNRDRRIRVARGQSVLAALLRSGRLPALLIAIGMAVLLYGFMFSADFLIASVEVRGVEMGDSAEIALAASAIGESIFRIDANHVAQRVAALPYVERVTVDTRFPDRVSLSVTERVPVLAFQSGRQTFVVDERGYIFGQAQAGSLPALNGTGDAPQVGDALNPSVVAAALAIHEALGDRLGVLRSESDRGLVASLLDGRTLVLGDASDMLLKLAIFEEVERRGEQWSQLDLREPGRPYYK